MTSNDSVSVFYDSLFHYMQTEYLLKNDVSWENIQNKLKVKLDQYETFEKSLIEVKYLFEKAGASHCQVFYNNQSYAMGNYEPSENDFSEQWAKKYSSYQDGKFEVKLIDDKYGYIYLPGWNFEDISSENIQIKAQPFYDAINQLKSNNEVEGWIIDLRLNMGGNSYPMLLGLYDFLGDNKIWGSLDLDGNWVNSITLNKGAYLDNNELISSISPHGKNLEKSKVAIITGKVTASSGEIVAIGFKERKNTIFIGEDSYGATTSNDKRELPFGAFMALTTGIDCDRKGKSYSNIKPDISIVKGDNFEDLLNDKNIIEAIKYFTK